jgi:ankyrin repeat protein
MPQWPWRNKRPGVDEYGRSPLWYRAADGDAAGVKAELKSGASATSADKNGYTALHVAAQNGHAEIVSLLIEAGADVNAVDKHGNGSLWTAGYEAAKAKATDANFSIVTMLLKAGADPHYRNRAGRTPETWRAVNPALNAVYVAAGFIH